MMGRMRLLLLFLMALVLLSSIAAAQPFGIKESIPEEAIRAVEKYMSALGKSRLEEKDRLGNYTFLFVVRVKSEEAEREDIIHYIIATKYLGYKIIYDSTEKNV